ncbi:Asp-tRNA(Asn)/Glu-tRNA(Gln) amidotransferase subunit GatC [Pseudogracilibacillus auburnensis]|uniref:Aspartyl/glutamyl-tRNA(Asn/Gln) amidotransferase subunit C n=1 Tax=Pseudogracilibacillus auburnensis TaxID=1494959 RepID=A0A2V3W8D2_9BACI|nr:Asp-tRNA(Asn)/Glu-tRNA(Gln) amidotransferase subunit GatC [Pseudogracilibacillus auburnensis]MBO1001198.1 Asp-tRNA(Asn)/Glu-tRNA(Gln) amidotransferase subunit GatC [Pseudogracilibacillus auburnensis]PXW90633.1 aspartyl/glutamyl-tRNA(Asn/Gln) amidotransferase subunit C [Pseudogracilibacillus auburnensis]
MATISKEDIIRTADLARLVLTDEEAQMYSEQLSEILTFTEKINEINTDDVTPTTNGNQITNVLRKDKPVQWEKQDEALENAPEHEDNQFKVPAIMD